MKLFHLSDLHIGKRVHEFSMLDDQRHILGEILSAAGRESPDGVIIAGDIYDKSVPSAEAVTLFDDFLFELSRLAPAVFIISGNHDSPERLSFGGRIIGKSGVHISPVYDGSLNPITLSDRFGAVNIYLLPFIKPVHVRRFFPDAPVESYTDAVRTALSAAAIDPTARNILVTHQFVTGSERSESEELSVGGADNVDAEVFAPFDYVALGHLHRPQNVAKGRIRYCGTPLKYSFSEADNKNSVTVVELAEKGSVSVSAIPLSPLRDMRRLRGSYAELSSRSSYEGSRLDDYIHLTLTNEAPVPFAFDRLRTIYPNLMQLVYDNSRTRSAARPAHLREIDVKSPLELFSEFYKAQNGRPMSEEQRRFIEGLLDGAGEEEL